MDLFAVGGLSDQLSFIIWSNISTALFSLGHPVPVYYAVYLKFFNDLTHPFLDNQPLFNAIYSATLTLLKGYSFNFMLVLTQVANVLISYKVFSKFRYGYVYTLIFCFSAYFWVHLGKHPDLSNIWAIPLFYYLLTADVSQNRRILWLRLRIPIYITTVTLISNYLGFFIIIFYSIYVFVNAALSIEQPLKQRFFIPIKNYLWNIAVTTCLLFLLLSPYFKQNYIDYKEVSPVNSFDSSVNIVHRPLEDFVTFSSRPWYFITPPLKNPFLGGISEAIISRAKLTNYFLADDYFADEHSANYFGTVLLVVFGALCIKALKTQKNIETTVLKKEILVLITTVFLLAILMLPPYFTVSGNVFYTPNYLIYLIFPMFRVTARLSIVILFLILVTVGKSLDILINRGLKKERLRLLNILLAFTLFETFVPVNIYRAGDVPAIYRFMQTSGETSDKYFIYPHSKVKEAFYWLPIHRKYIVNVFIPPLSDSAMKDLSENELRNLGVDRMIIFKNNGSTAGFNRLLENNEVIYTDEVVDVVGLRK